MVFGFCEETNPLCSFPFRRFCEVNVDMKGGVTLEQFVLWSGRQQWFWTLFVCFFQIKYRQDFHKMKGAAHYHSLPAQDNLVLTRAQHVNKLVSEVSVGYSRTYVNRATPEKKPSCVMRHELHVTYQFPKEWTCRGSNSRKSPESKKWNFSDGSKVSSWILTGLRCSKVPGNRFLVARTLHEPTFITTCPAYGAEIKERVFWMWSQFS